MKNRDFPRAIVFGLFIGAGAYIAAGAWHITGLALPGIVLAAAVGAFLLSLLSAFNQRPAAEIHSGSHGRSSSSQTRPGNSANADQQAMPSDDPHWWCDYDNPFSFQRTSDEIFNKHH